MAAGIFAGAKKLAACSSLTVTDSALEADDSPNWRVHHDAHQNPARETVFSGQTMLKFPVLESVSGQDDPTSGI